MKLLKLMIGSGFGAGYSPIMPGTTGSLAAIIPLALLNFWIGWPAVVLFVLISAGLSLWATDACENAWGQDPGRMVIDEFAGQAIPFLAFTLTGFGSHNMLLIAAAFGLFRIFDIWKPLGIHKLQGLHGGWGILADDLLAGLYAFLCLKSLILVSPATFGAG